MKVKEIRQLSDAELKTKLNDLKVELFNLRFQAATGSLDNPLRIRVVRKEIAKIKTIEQERVLGIRKEA
ncbi:MAG: 50S ribosomal protein L29 [Ezakiella sp.]|nr:50S ribosomal protein L29 [Ezakiella sp.]MDD7761250.1 50S ribosomal protein L29 [Bacillota bacterium]MDY3947579.1 50S ribosomal protein L29 [Ezakiella sp.]